MNVEDLCAGTRPRVAERHVLMTAAEGFDGYEIMEYRGMCWGISVRAKDLGQDCLMGCKHVTGGELTSYTQLADESRQKAIDRMLLSAVRMRANAIINVRFDLEAANQGATQVVAWGTAVQVEPIKNYVPVGAVGNVLVAIHDKLGSDDDAKR